MKMKLLKLLTLLMMVNPAFSYAQGHSGVGGGDATASDFQDYVNKVDAYLLTDEGRTLFPEIKQPAFHEMAMSVKPVVKDERVYDSFGVAQTCVSHVDTDQKYFQCDLHRLPKIELNSQPTFYRLTFHELLFQAGMELPISSSVPSSFLISSRLQLRLETFQAWVPGSAAAKTEDCVLNVRSSSSKLSLYGESMTGEIIRDGKKLYSKSFSYMGYNRHNRDHVLAIDMDAASRAHGKCETLRDRLIRAAESNSCQPSIFKTIESMSCKLY